MLLVEARSLVPQDFGILNEECGVLFAEGEYAKAFSLILDSEKAVEGKDSEHEEVFSFRLYDIALSVIMSLPARAIHARSILPENLQNNASVLYYAGYAYLSLYDAEKNPDGKPELYTLSRDYFRKSEQEGIKLNENIFAWIDQNAFILGEE